MNHRGISLLEVTVAMGVLALCLVPVMQMVGTMCIRISRFPA